MALRMMYKKYDQFKKTSEELQNLIGINFSDEVLFERFCSHFVEKFDDTEWWTEMEEIVEYE